jgi:hypothetical protein
MYERQLLRELEALRGDISHAAKKVIPAANGAPKPSIIPPLEDDRLHAPPAPSAPLANGFQREIRTQPPHTAGITQSGFIPHHVPTQPNSFNTQNSLPSPFPQTPTERQDPLSAASFRSFTPTQAPSSPTLSQTSARQQLPLQSPGAGPSSPAIPSGIPARQAVDEPPLGGRFVDGTKSMFVPKTTSSPRPSPLSFSSSVSNIAGPSSTAPSDPLRSDSYASVSSPLQNTSLLQQPSRPQHIDPLGLGTPQTMSRSLRIQPTRPRLDAREAASKLANMF